MSKDKCLDFARAAFESCILNPPRIVWKWAPYYHFHEGDKVLWQGTVFSCVKEHRSGKEFNNKYWRTV